MSAGGDAPSAGRSAAAGTTGGAAVAGGSSGGKRGGAGTSAGGASAGTGAAGGASAGGDALGGMGGEGVLGGAGGSVATPAVCSFDISGALSPDIGTVGVIDWSTDLQGVTSAKIQFSLDDPSADELNVGSGGPISVSESRALLLGLKPGRSYTYHIEASRGSTVCVSDEHELSTKTDPNAPVVTITAGAHAGSRSNGFILTCNYAGGGYLVIVDTDGAVVWWTQAAINCSRAHMDWDGQYLWAMNANPLFADMGAVERVKMDGSVVEQIAGLEWSHHDFAVLPGGTTAFLSWANQDIQSSELVERAPDGTFHTVTVLDDTSYLVSVTNNYHANALRYYASTDSYSVSDLSFGGLTAFDRQGKLVWQATGFHGMHGHELLSNGDLLYFEAHNGSTDASPFDPSPVYEYGFSEQAGTLAAMKVWSFDAGASSVILGDVWRLPNGNTLITYSTGHTIVEVTPAGEILQSLSLPGEIGYTDFRETLYGPPAQAR